MPNKEEVIAEIIALMKTHEITTNDIARANQESPVEKNKLAVRKFFGFLGGIFILCGLGIYIGQNWLAMNSVSRIIITFGVGIALLILALVASNDDRYEKLITPLFLIAALFETTGLFVAADELKFLTISPQLTSLFIMGIMFLQQMLIFSQKPRTSILFISIVLGITFFYIYLDYIHVRLDYQIIVLGFSLLCIAYGLNSTTHKSIVPFWYLVSSLIFLFGLFLLLEGKSVEIIFLGVSIFIIYLSTLVRSRTLLFVGTIATIFYIGLYTQRHFVNSLGWPLALILLGFIMIGIGAMAIRLAKRIK